MPIGLILGLDSPSVGEYSLSFQELDSQFTLDFYPCLRLSSIQTRIMTLVLRISFNRTV